MRRIIGNVLYDTEQSTLIYTDEDNRRRWYMTNNGRFFIAYLTGEISVTSEDTVKLLLGEKDIDKYIELFGLPEEG